MNTRRFNINYIPDYRVAVIKPKGKDQVVLFGVTKYINPKDDSLSGVFGITPETEVTFYRFSEIDTLTLTPSGSPENSDEEY